MPELNLTLHIGPGGYTRWLSSDSVVIGNLSELSEMLYQLLPSGRSTLTKHQAWYFTISSMDWSIPKPDSSTPAHPYAPPKHLAQPLSSDSMRSSLPSPGETFEPVTYPEHYVSHPSGIECIEVTRHMTFNLGNVVKYVWRADRKNGLEDLRKARWYLEDEIKRQEIGTPSADAL